MQIRLPSFLLFFLFLLFLQYHSCILPDCFFGVCYIVLFFLFLLMRCLMIQHRLPFDSSSVPIIRPSNTVSYFSLCVSNERNKSCTTRRGYPIKTKHKKINLLLSYQTIKRCKKKSKCEQITACCVFVSCLLIEILQTDPLKNLKRQNDKRMLIKRKTFIAWIPKENIPKCHLKIDVYIYFAMVCIHTYGVIVAFKRSFSLSCFRSSS